MELYKLKAEISKAFSDPKRLIIITELRDGEKTVGELVEAWRYPRQYVPPTGDSDVTSGVVKPRRAGNNIFTVLQTQRICEACDIVHEVLMDHLARNRELAESLLVLILRAFSQRELRIGQGDNDEQN